MTTKEETLRRIAVMQAWCDGELIQLRTKSGMAWINNALPDFDWSNCDYRIAPKPKRKVKFYAHIGGLPAELRFFSDARGRDLGWTRIPSLDLEAEVDD